MIDYILYADPMTIEGVCKLFAGFIAGCFAAFFALNNWSL